MEHVKKVWVSGSKRRLLASQRMRINSKWQPTAGAHTTCTPTSSNHILVVFQYLLGVLLIILNAVHPQLVEVIRLLLPHPAAWRGMQRAQTKL